MNTRQLNILLSLMAIVLMHPAMASEHNSTLVEGASIPQSEQSLAPSSEMSTLVMVMEPEWCNCSHLELKTNLIYWMGTMPNVALEWQPCSSRISLQISGGYAPLSFQNWDQGFGGWLLSPEVRYYLGRSRHGFLGIKALGGGYNVKLDIIDETGRQGNMLAAGLTGGYKQCINRTMEIEFSLGVGYGAFTYDEYIRLEGCNYLTSTGNEFKSPMPIEAGISLIWKLR